MTIIEASSFDDRKKVPTIYRYRTLTLDEIKSLRGHALIVRNDGKVGNVKINGAIKRWKREPDRVEVPVKYGMYECTRFDTAEALRRFVVQITDDNDSDEAMRY